MADRDIAGLHRDTVSWADYARYRADIYRTVSAAFALEPDEEHLRALLDLASSALPDSCVRRCEWVFLNRIAKMDARDLARVRTDIASEYAELFVGPRPPLAPLYESLYVGFPSRLCTGQTDLVRKFYARFGYRVVKEHRVPEDHMAYEVEFLGRLCSEEASALAQGDISRAFEYERAQCEFVTCHLNLWTKDFATRVADAGMSGYYLAWADFLRDFALEDNAFLSESLSLQQHGTAH